MCSTCLSVQYVFSVECCCLTLTSPAVNSALTFPDDKENPPTALGQLLWEWTGQYLCLSCVCTCVFWCWRNLNKTFSHLSTLLFKLHFPCTLLPLAHFVAFWIFSGLVWVLFILAVFVFPCCAASLSYVGMCSHILATVAACFALTCMTFLIIDSPVFSSTDMKYSMLKKSLNYRKTILLNFN